MNGKLPNSPPARVADRLARAEPAVLVESLAQMTLTVCARIGFADIDDPLTGHPQCSQLGDGDSRVFSFEMPSRRYIEEPRRLITRSHDDVHTRLGRHASSR